MMIREVIRTAAPILILAGLFWAAAFHQHETNQRGVIATLYGDGK